MLKIYNFIIQILGPHFIFGTGAPKIYNKRERSPGHYHKPKMGGRYHMERQWRPTQDLTETGRATTPASGHWVRNHAARRKEAAVHMSQPSWHGNVAAGRHGKD
jgi:hypothetical protein